jgi:outer membrane lipoprotein-sorting protein
VDKKSFMPISIKIYDEEGIFEAYDSYNVVINSSFASDEFSKNFKGYHF